MTTAAEFSPATIRAVETLLLKLPISRPIMSPFGRLDARPNLLVRVRTDDGAEGLGEIWANFPPWGCEERIAIVRHAITPSLIGETLDDPRRLYALIHARLRLLANQWGAPGPVHQAIAGVDIALWDAFARRRGKPLAHLLRDGGAAYDRVPVYASGIAPPHVEETIATARANGHTRFKIRVAFGLEKDRETLRLARRAAPADPLMADANQTLTRESFEALRPALAEANLEFLEEPFPVDDEEAYATYPADAPPLAYGENAQGARAFDAIIARAAIVQPDITKTGGLTGGLEIGRRAIAAGRKLCLHMFGGAVGLYASAHLTAALDGAHWLEMDVTPNPLLEETLLEKPVVENGALVLPKGGGLGVTLAHPFP